MYDIYPSLPFEIVTRNTALSSILQYGRQSQVSPHHRVGPPVFTKYRYVLDSSVINVYIAAPLVLGTPLPLNSTPKVCHPLAPH